MARVSSPETVPGAVEAFRVALDSDLEAPQALLALRDDRLPVALVGRWAGGGALLASEPLRVLTGTRAGFDVLAGRPSTPEAWLKDRGGPGPPDPSAVAQQRPAERIVGGGWFGHLGFALAHAVEELPGGPPRVGGGQRAVLAYYDHLLRRDADGRWWFEALATEPRRAALDARLAVLRERLEGERPRPRPWAVEGLAPRAPGYAGHRAAVADCVERIAAGEIFQANLCMRFDGRLSGAAIDAFAHACTVLRPAYGAYLGIPGGPLLSLSPELFLRREGRAVRTAPIKGTIARVGEPCAARRARERLVRSPKDAAEHVMIVDLMRNDLGRVCEYGTVTAGRAPRAESHPGVWHLVGDVAGELRDGVDDAALLRAAFPPGSVTGAPKVQALKVIAALEATAREAYTGAIGYASPLAGLELNVAIRTFETRGERIWLGAGGGIVADSDPDQEVREVWRKAAPLARALGTELEAPPSGGQDAIGHEELRTSHPGGAAGPPPAPDGLRPRPDDGVLETLAVRDGRPSRLAEHLDRLASSAAQLWGATLPPDLGGRALAACEGCATPLARLRIVAAPADDGLRCRVEPLAPERAPVGSVTLVPVAVPGGLGAHKWADRRLVDALASGAGACALLCDLDGAVLEAGWATVWILEGDALVTPPADGRILPGITRAALLAAVPGATETAFGLDRLRAADAVLLTSSVRLVTPARAPGRPQPPAAAGAVAERLRATLAAIEGRLSD